jgi:preprotein translocase subunit SecE
MSEERKELIRTIVLIGLVVLLLAAACWIAFKV